MTGRVSRGRLVSLAVWIAVTIALIIAARSLPWQSALQQLSRVRGEWLGIAILCNVAILVVWAAEWRLLVPAVTEAAYSGMFAVVSTMATVLNSIPFFAGEATGVALLVERIGLARGAALSVLALDQLLSGIAKLLVLATAALLVPLPPWLRTGLLALVAGVAALLTTLLMVAHGWQGVRTRLLATPTPVRRLLARAVSLGVHLEALRETRRSRQLLLLAAAKKAMELGGIMAVQAALGLPPSLVSGVLVLASLSVATLAPVAPANVGVYEAAVFAAYRYVGVPADVALALAVVQHVCFLLPMLATGYVTLSVRQLATSRRA